MRILVTGATGRVGSRLVPRLLQRGDAVRILVRNPEQGALLVRQGALLPQRGALPPQTLSVAVGDLLRPETLAEAVAGIDAAVHLAAFFRGATPEEARTVNEDGTLNLAEAAMAAGVPRFVFTSTNLIYGPGRGRPATEADLPQPGGAYPVSKVAAERALLDLHRTRGLGLRILRLAFVYGDGDPHLTEGVQLWLRNWHPQKRLQLVHHADVARAVFLALDAPGIDGRIYNVADDEPATAAAIMQLMGQPVAADAADRPLDDPWEGIVSTARIQAELGFRPLYPTVHAAAAAGVL